MLADIGGVLLGQQQPRGDQLQEHGHGEERDQQVLLPVLLQRQGVPHLLHRGQHVGQVNRVLNITC